MSSKITGKKTSFAYTGSQKTAAHTWGATKGYYLAKETNNREGHKDAKKETPEAQALSASGHQNPA